ncbi:NAD(P)-binding domain-containing protein [Falsiroseomonas oryzae]|uniref:NAD(P)-binding domain-containing protein n=1 Tax=Falsiroseomonas oryzae TaxID=2766473 RepID=UPI0022EA9540|nr:NAD(P)/FAD-dependent oxidoreductase [Roseomonas sp. MO-31]
MLDAANAPPGLDALEARLRQDLAWLELPAKSWVPPRMHRGEPVADVAIIGGGLCGLVAAAALRLLGIDRVRVLDRAPQGQEGPWVTYARMETLRSPKTLAGPALDLPALTFRAWFEAQHGTAAFAALGKIPRVTWMEYLIWYRRVMGIAVENGVEVTLIRPEGDDLLALETQGAGTVVCRRVVMATGRDGLGAAWMPEIAAALPAHLRAHSRDDIDFAALAGKRVGVVGAGASAMDNAGAALEAGCARLDMFVRRPALPRVNKFTGIGSPGVVHGFAGLPDAWKWRFLDYVFRSQTPPPRESTMRVSRHPHASLHLASPIRALSLQGDAIRLETPEAAFELDFLILATGFRVDLAGRPELALLGPHIRFWRDRFTPEPGEENEELSDSPDLAPDFAFQEREPGACPALQRVHCFNYPATLSHGKLSGDIPAVSAGAQRLARGIARALFVEDRELHFAALQRFDTPELLGDEWPDRP